MVESWRESTDITGTGSKEAEDEVLAQAAKQGDREARNALFMRHQPLVRALAGPARRDLRAAILRGYINPILEYADIEQQAFLIFCDLLQCWQPECEPFMALLRRRLPGRLRHYVRDTLHYSQSGRVRGTVPYQQDVGRENAQVVPSPGGEALAWEEHLGSLPALLRRSIELRYGHDLPSTKIGQMVGRSKRTVNRDLRAALLTLRRSVVSTWEDCA